MSRALLNPAGSVFHATLAHRAQFPRGGWLAVLAGLGALLLASGGAAGGRIAYASDATGDYEIYVMDVQGNPLGRLTDSESVDAEPFWSYDGSRIVFVSNRDGDYDIYRMNADGGNVVNLSNNDTEDGGPVFSHACANLRKPCTEWIAFDSERTGDWEIYMMDSDGGNVTQLTDSPGEDWWPSWSPDGKKIAFMSVRGGYDFDIYVLDLTTGELNNYTNTPDADEYWAAWSPDGSLIAYTKFDFSTDGFGHIWVMDAGCTPECGANQRQVTAATYNNDLEPAWSPDGQWLAFGSDRDPESEEGWQWDYEIFIIHLDGSQLTQVTRNEGVNDLTPGWGK